MNTAAADGPTIRPMEAAAQTPASFGPSALAAGFANGPGGAHDGKTMMLPELRALLAAVPGKAAAAQYRGAAIEDNVLGKRTAATRSKTFQYLRKLYALDGTVPIFATLRELWPADPDAQPLLAVLSAVARDPLLRATLPVIRSLQRGDVTGPAQLAAAVADAFPGRYNPSVLHHIGQNTGATWTQAGLLKGTRSKVRSTPMVTYPAVVFALYLGHLQGTKGPALLDTTWTRLLDTTESALRSAADTAARHGWLDIKAAGGMTEITFRHLDGLTQDIQT